MTTRLLFAFVLVLSLSACAQREGDVMANDMNDDTMTDNRMMTAPAVTVEGTLAAAQNAGGLTRLAPNVAVQNIDGWIARLQGMDGTGPIVSNLRTLKSQLQAPTLDGMAIGRTLSQLGEQTTTVAAGNGDLRQLGQALSQAGSMLTGM